MAASSLTPPAPTTFVKRPKQQKHSTLIDLKLSSTSTLCAITTRRSRRRRAKMAALPLIAANIGAQDTSPLFNAAKHTVDSYARNGMVIGLGAGNASTMAIQYLGRQLRMGALRDIVGIPMSVASASEAAKVGIPLDIFSEQTKIDFAFDDADIIEEETLIAVIGRRKFQGEEESLIHEKSILNAADTLVFMVLENQYKGNLDGSIPVLVPSLNWLQTAEELDDLFLGDAEVWRRPSIGHADPVGGEFPLVTREGHNVLDIIFTSPIQSLAEVAKILDQVDGVVDHGIISKTPCTAVIASRNELNVVDNRTTNAGRIVL